MVSTLSCNDQARELSLEEIAVLLVTHLTPSQLDSMMADLKGVA